MKLGRVLWLGAALVYDTCGSDKRARRGNHQHQPERHDTGSPEPFQHQLPLQHHVIKDRLVLDALSRRCSQRHLRGIEWKPRLDELY